MSRFWSVLLMLFLQMVFYNCTTIKGSFSSQRIAEGELTTQGEYPFVLSLGLTSWADVYHLHQCSGSIVTETWVVTSAQCVEDAVEDVSRYYWLVGTNNLRQTGAQYPINSIVIHPGYNPNDSYIHDIALTQVRRPFEFSATIQPVILSNSLSTTQPGVLGIVVGWGEISQTIIQPDILRSAEVTIIDVDICRGIYATWDLNIDGEYQFCAVTTGFELNGPPLFEVVRKNEAVENEIDYREIEYEDNYNFIADRSACRGDEGGPFSIRRSNFPFITASGIVSWTYGCTPYGYPAVYTKISSYLNWISENTGYWIIDFE